MPVIISMLRGVNVGGHNKIKMDALRLLYESLKLRDPQTHLQSGNVVFRTEERDLVLVSKRIHSGIERLFGFRVDVILRTIPEFRSAIARNPFANRRNIESSKLLVTFLAGEPSLEARKNVLSIEAAPEELHIDGRELYIYFPNGMARPKLTWPVLERALKISGTGRNWSTVIKLLEIAEHLESSA
ncbi:MAG: DUF1697 domain-containing protein [Candidatus Acidiferrales bacterium]